MMLCCLQAAGADVPATKTGQPAKSSLKVRIGEPSVVAVASRPEKWGFFQFPGIERWPDGTLAATWQMAADSIVSYGVGAPSTAISKDGGKTWMNPNGKEGVTGLLLPNGDRIKVITPKAIKTSELLLPAPASEIASTNGKVKLALYRLADLPPEVQGVCISRLAKGSAEWVPERAALDDPQALRYSLHGLFPIVWWGDMHVARDGAIITGIYPGYRLFDNGGVDPKCGVFFYRSTDAGHSWKVQGRIPWQPDLAANSKGVEPEDFTEPAFEILADGSFLCVIRSTGQRISPMYSSHSRDMGRTWSRPVVMAPNGVLPRLLRLANGVVVLASGRPGVQLRFSANGRGETWTEPYELVPFTNQKNSVSCGYTSILAAGPDRFLIIYSDFKHKNAAGETRKAIKVREVVVTPESARRLRAPKLEE